MGLGLRVSVYNSLKREVSRAYKAYLEVHG